MIGVINLFISILRSPKSSTAESDVALLDLATGYFGHLQFVTASELNFSFPREVSRLARATVARTHDQSSTKMSTMGSLDIGLWAEPNDELWENVDFMRSTI